MADIDWRVWIKTKLDAYAPLLVVVPAAQIVGSGSLEEAPGVRPFIMIRAGFESRGPFPGVSTRNATLWVHDDPGDYMRIDNIMKLCRAALEGPVSESGGVACRWAGDSTELADEGFKTICRNQSYQLQGKDGNA